MLVSDPPTPSRTLLVAFAVGVGLLFTAQASHWALMADDAFISFRYADHLVERGELAYNVAERVEGYSNLLWVLLLAGFSAIGVAPTRAAPLLGYVFGLATLGTVYWSARNVLGCSRAATFAALAWLATSISWSFWSVAGMESALFSLLLLGLWAAGWSEQASRFHGALWVALLCGLLALTRPEGAAGVLLVPAVLGVRPRLRRRLWLGATLCALTLVLALLGWRWLYYGTWLPNSVHAKVALNSATLLRGGAYLWSFLWDEQVIVLLPLLVLAGRKDARYLTLLLIVAGYFAFIVVAGGDGLYRYRLPAHVAPLLAVGFAAGLQRVLSLPARLKWPIGVAAGLASVIALLRPGFFRDFTLVEVRQWEERWTLVGKSVAQHTPPNSSLATNVAGRVPYFSRRRTLDLLGLNDAVIARTDVHAFGSGYAGHERAAPAYVLEWGPDLVYLSVLDGLPREAFKSLHVVRHVLGLGSMYRYVPLVEGVEFRSRYRPAFLRLSDGRWANVFVREEREEAMGKRGVQVEGWR
jgi:arabinofuranosyltransferase